MSPGDTRNDTKKEKRTILVVDDEEELRELFRSRFESKGWQVFEAGNGTDAFKIVSKEPIQCILSDVRMPGGDGVSLLKNVVKKNGPNMPIVVLMTGYADITRDEIVNLGAKELFHKPFDMKVIYASIDSWVNQKQI